MLISNIGRYKFPYFAEMESHTINSNLHFNLVNSTSEDGGILGCQYHTDTQRISMPKHVLPMDDPYKLLIMS